MYVCVCLCVFVCVSVFVCLCVCECVYVIRSKFDKVAHTTWVETENQSYVMADNECVLSYLPSAFFKAISSYKTSFKGDIN